MRLRDIVRLLYENQWTKGLLTVVLKYKIGYRTVIDRTPVQSELDDIRRMKVDKMGKRETGD